MTSVNIVPPRGNTRQDGHDGAGGLLATALAYARRGWPVVPLWWIADDGGCACGTDCGDRAGKHPIGGLVPHGVTQATTDPEVIRRWWRRAPRANIGITTGPASGLLVLDVDPRHGGDEHLAALERRHGVLPRTPTVRTGSGGAHYYFRHPTGVDIRNSTGRLGPGLDVKAAGGYVIAPPSTHRSGGRYRWDIGAHPDDVALAAAPDWLLADAAAATPTVGNGQPLDVARAVHGVPKGQRHDHLFRLTCKLRALGFSPDEALAVVALAARRCDPPWGSLPDDREPIEALVRRVYTTYPPGFGLSYFG